MVRIILKIIQEAFVTLATVQDKLEAAVLNLNECHLNSKLAFILLDGKRY